MKSSRVSLHGRPLRLVLAACAAMLPIAEASAQEFVEFFDDFSVDSTAFIVDDRPDDRGERTYEVVPNGLRMTTSSTGEVRSFAEVRVSDRTDVVRARINLSSETKLLMDNGSGDEPDARIGIQGFWWNEIQDGGLGDGDGTGDVFASVALRLNGDGIVEYLYCLDRKLEDGSYEGIDLFDGNFCGSIPGFVPALDTDYDVRIALDRKTGTIAFGIDGREAVTPIGLPVFLPAFSEKMVTLSQVGMGGRAVGTVSAIGTDDDMQDFSEQPYVKAPYRPLFDLEQGNKSLTVTDGRARFEIGADGENYERLGLMVFGATDSIKAILELSSDSMIGAGPFSAKKYAAEMGIGGVFYNDTAEGGFNENEGDVFAGLFLRLQPDGSRLLNYCLYRSNTTDSSDETELVMEGGTECGEFGLIPDLDTPYEVSIETDLEGGLVIFTADGVERVHTITTAAFAPDSERQFVRTEARTSGGSRAVGFLDDFRTSDDAPHVSGNTDGGSGSGGSSGGCSIGSGRSGADPMFALLGAIALGALIRRRRTGLADPRRMAP